MVRGIMKEENTQKMLALLGLARRAGKLALGFSAVEKLVRRQERPFIVAASDMGASLKGKVVRYEGLAGLVDDALTGDQMAQAFGRDKLAIIAVSDPGFVKGIKKLID